MMAAVMKRHVQLCGEDSQPLCKDCNDRSDSEGGSNEEKSDDGEEKEDVDGKERDDSNVSAGWAEAMAKILGKKTPESKSSILLRNKGLDKVKERETQEQLEWKKRVDKRRAWEMLCREKPDVVKDRETERTLQRVATRGVVQLFNAVRKHQTTMEHKVQEVGGSERKKAKILSSVSRKDFIDVLRKTEGGGGGGGGGSGNTDKDAAATPEEKPAWSVLRDDFMIGATMKDWDKDSDKEEADPQMEGEVEDSD